MQFFICAFAYSAHVLHVVNLLASQLRYCRASPLRRLINKVPISELLVYY